MLPTNESLSAEVLNCILQCSNRFLVLIESYFDESGSDKNSPVLCLAGYLFSSDQARHFDREWNEVLDKYGLEYFRMSECAHGTGVFLKLSKPDRVQIQTKLISIIKRRVELGFAVTVEEPEYNRLLPSAAPNVRPALGDAYSWCVHNCIAGIGSWINYHKIEAPRTAFFFEAGHRSQKLANSIVTSLFSVPSVKAQYGYTMHGFAEKSSLCPLQAADLLAWQWGKDYKRRLERKPRRRDLDELLETSHWALHWTPEMLRSSTIFHAMFDKKQIPNS